jgi:RNA polymerase-interacting CarD/CdnL/TRCF family regulator
MLELNQIIVHPRYGPGTITDKRTIERNGEPREYYCMELPDDDGMVFLPADRVDEAGLRPAEVDAALIERIMAREPQEMDSDHKKRQARLRKVLRGGEPRKLIQALRDLCWREQQRNLTTNDSHLKARTRERLERELALKAHIELSAAQQRLTAIIDRAMRQHQAELELEAEGA